MSEYRFLIDRSADSVRTLFPRKRVHTLERLGLPEDASDARIVRVAWQKRCILVTANGDDFVHEIENFQKKQMRRECHELYGLIVLPNEFANQKLALSRIKRVAARFGGRDISWPEVWKKNLYVRLKKIGAPEVKRFSRCHYCEKNTVG